MKPMILKNGLPSLPRFISLPILMILLRASTSYFFLCFQLITSKPYSLYMHIRPINLQHDLNTVLISFWIQKTSLCIPFPQSVYNMFMCRWISRSYAFLSLFRMAIIFCLDNWQEYKRYESLQKNYIDAYKWSKHGFLPLSDARSVLDLGI